MRRAGNLYVADTDNNRVLEYDTPLTSGTTADRVFGQGGSFASALCNNGGVSADNLCAPFGLTVDRRGNLYVAEDYNNRVLEYDTPLTSGTTADRVFGQGGSFTSNFCNNGGATANSLCGPQGLAVDGAGNLYVADWSNNRVLEYDTPLTSGTTADRVLGQVSFALKETNLVDGRGLYGPSAVAIDGSVTPNRIYVADSGNNRVLAWADATAFMNGDPADRVIGQPDFFSFDYFCFNNGVSSADSLCGPGDVAVDGAGNLYVPDTDKHRVLEYNGPRSVCGNGLAESGESCDDGNTVNGDCCSSACQLEPDGTTCDDGNSCTSSDACQSGMCTGACQVGTVCGSGCDGTLRCTLNGSTCSCR